ncbi:1,2-phenylacetyl-CoA epoxidase subunit PaaC [Hazenella coriacea]|uniref:Ring-1,2-phenylacetyl-CoA epoxidase subunit PaaC n=1 Tax=Hazenella coriacea TaxID=1179467 RepID=A0A4R3LAS1_9BACL|nr:1,2-phenylacetyl-CoA epoxidase subunit PaaC [Hazenella coriacea]TCS96849.1 ring-1,2-phenylacetyl-CoA epoxidase subunit PaaC [Hazenella coriacea]
MVQNHESNEQQVLRDWLFQLADDEFTIGHRDSEWLGLCPDIEGDVAFSSIAQDEIGHALFYYELLHQCGEKDPDQLAFARSIEERRNAILLERTNGDWAYSIARHFFYDLFDHLRLEAMLSSTHTPLAQGVAKMKREETYHLQHMKLCFVRLGQAGGEARERLEKAIESIWPDVKGLFCFGPHEQQLLEMGIISESSDQIQDKWQGQIRQTFVEANLTYPGDFPVPQQEGRLGEHSQDLSDLLDTVTEVYRLEPLTRW